MNFFIFGIIWLLLIWYLYVSKPKEKLFLELMIVLPLILFATLRDNFRFMVDTNAYVRGFQYFPMDFAHMKELYLRKFVEPGFMCLEYVVKSIWDNAEFFLFVVSSVCILPVNYIFRRYSPNYVYSWILFFVCNSYFSWICNGIRQGIAITVLFCSIPFLLRKKYVICVLFVLLAMLFHYTAVLFLPFIFLCQGKALNKYIIIFTIVILFLVYHMRDLLALVDTGITYLEGLNAAMEEGKGMSFIRLIISSIPFVIALPSIKRIRQINDPLVNICVNMCFATTAFYLLACFTSGILVGRIPGYFSYFTYILIPWEIKFLFKPKMRGKVALIIAGIYFLVFIAELASKNLLFEKHFLF